MSAIKCSEFEASFLRTDSSNVKDIPGKNLKIVDLKWQGESGKTVTPPSIEFDEGVPMKYNWSAHDEHSRKICIDIEQSKQWQLFLSKIEKQAISLASDLSEKITGVQRDTSYISEYMWSPLGSAGHIKLNFNPSYCPTFYTEDSKTLSKRQMSIEEIPKGSIVYPVVRPIGMWYADQFGITFSADGLVIKPATAREFDFIRDSGKTFATNRLLGEVDLESELKFNHDIFTTRKGGLMYFFNMRTAELPQMTTPFGAVQNDEGTGVSMQLDVPRESVKAFVTKLDEIVIDGATREYLRWFGKPMTREVMAEHLYKFKTLKKQRDSKYDDKIKLKLITDESNDNYTDVFVEGPDGVRKGNWNDITSQSSVVVQFKVSHLWFKGSKKNINGIGTTLVADRVLVLPGEDSRAVTSFHNFRGAEEADEPVPDAPRLPELLDEDAFY